MCVCVCVCVVCVCVCVCGCVCVCARAPSFPKPVTEIGPGWLSLLSHGPLNYNSYWIPISPGRPCTLRLSSLQKLWPLDTVLLQSSGAVWKSTEVAVLGLIVPNTVIVRTVSLDVMQHWTRALSQLWLSLTTNETFKMALIEYAHYCWVKHRTVKMKLTRSPV